MDIESVKGRFGWETIVEGCALPFIKRIIDNKCQKFVSVRIAEKQLLSEYLKSLDASILQCTSVQGHLITEAEAKLLNDLNQNHAKMYGIEPFLSGKECVVLIEDLKEFYTFIVHCYKKLKGIITPALKEKCGFIMLNSVSVLPYCYRTEDTQKYLPLFFFEGTVDVLQREAIQLDKWNGAYLKFCCMVQGINKDKIAENGDQVISLEVLKKYFPPPLKIEVIWPEGIANKHWLLNLKNGAPIASGSWANVLESTPLTPKSTVDPTPLHQPCDQRRPTYRGPFYLTAHQHAELDQQRIHY